MSFLYPLASPGDVRLGDLATSAVGSSIQSFSQLASQYIGGGFETIYIPLFKVDEFHRENGDFPGLLSAGDARAILCAQYQESLPHINLEEIDIITTMRSVIKGASLEELSKRQGLDVGRYCGKEPTLNAKGPSVWKTGPIELMASYDPVLHLSHWKVVSARFEMCHGTRQALILKGGETVTSKAIPGDVEKSCTSKLRLVAQPLAYPTRFNGVGNGAAARDYAVHLIYDIPMRDPAGAGFADMLQSLIRVKAFAEENGFPTTGRPLSIHPAFGAVDNAQNINLALTGGGLPAGRRTPMESFLQAARFSSVLNPIIEKFAKRDRLKSVSTMFANIDRTGQIATSWNYVSLESTSGGGLGVTHIPMVGGSSGEKKFIMAHLEKPRIPAETFSPDLAPNFRAGVNLPNIQPLMALAYAHGRSPFGSSEKADALLGAFEDSHRIDDPFTLNIKSIDCVSCHTSTPYRTMAMNRSPEELRRRLSDSVERERSRLVSLGVDASLERLQGAFADHLLSQEHVVSSGAFFARPNSQMTFRGYDPNVLDSQRPDRSASKEIKRDFFNRREEWLAGVNKESLENPIYRVDYVQRQFGYFGALPMVSQRVINESAVSAAFMNARVSRESFPISRVDLQLKIKQSDLLHFVSRVQQAKIDPLVLFHQDTGNYRKVLQPGSANVQKLAELCSAPNLKSTLFRSLSPTRAGDRPDSSSMPSGAVPDDATIQEAVRELQSGGEVAGVRGQLKDIAPAKIELSWDDFRAIEGLVFQRILEERLNPNDVVELSDAVDGFEEKHGQALFSLLDAKPLMRQLEPSESLVDLSLLSKFVLPRVEDAVSRK